MELMRVLMAILDTPACVVSWHALSRVWCWADTAHQGYCQPLIGQHHLKLWSGRLCV